MIEIGPNLKEAIKVALVVVPILAVFGFAAYCRKKNSEDSVSEDAESDDGYSVGGPYGRSYQTPKYKHKRKKKCRAGKCHHKHCKG